MSLEQEIFSRRTLKPETLEPFGFVREGRVWQYQELFLDGDFRAEVSVAENGQVLGRVFDVADDEEYLPVHVDSYTGAFVGSVREGYTAVLRLGVETDTGDVTGNVIRTSDRRVTRKELLAALPAFTGRIRQVPPLYSAIWVNGRRLYEIARSGDSFDF